MEHNRYDVEVIRADNHEADTRRWIDTIDVIAVLNTLQEGDDMVVHHVGHAEPDMEYGT